MVHSYSSPCCCCSLAQFCTTFCNPKDCSTPGFPVHHQLPELAKTHVHWVSDAIQPSHPLLSPSPPTFNHSQHQGLFQWNQFFTSGSQSIGASASHSLLLINIQDWFPLWWTSWISLQSKGLSSLLQHHSSKASILQRCNLQKFTFSGYIFTRILSQMQTSLISRWYLRWWKSQNLGLCSDFHTKLVESADGKMSSVSPARKPGFTSKGYGSLESESLDSAESPGEGNWWLGIAVSEEY